MSKAVRPRIFTLETRERWGLPHAEERGVKMGVRGAVKAYAREIRMAFGHDREILWVVM